MSSRNEDILKSILGAEKYEKIPQSRIEALLIDVADLIRKGGATDAQVAAAVTEYIESHPVLVTVSETSEAEAYLGL